MFPGEFLFEIFVPFFRWNKHVKRYRFDALPYSDIGAANLWLFIEGEKDFEVGQKLKVFLE